jgi:hypothetical protein
MSYQYPITSMARGSLVVDEQISELTIHLRNKNFYAETPPPGMGDEDIKKDLIQKKIFITENDAHFLRDQLKYEYSLILIEKSLLADTKSAANMIGRAIIEHSIMSIHKRGDLFILTIKKNSKTHQYESKLKIVGKRKRSKS